MAYRQYTKCVSINNYIGTVAAQIIVAAAIGVFPLLAAAIAGAALAPAILIPILLAIIAYCRWWLYDRLICLGGDKCAVGLLIAAEPPDEKSGFDAFDTDYSINLLLADNPIGAEQADVEKSFQGDLVKNQLEGHGLPWKGEKATTPNSGDKESAVLHAEFEGAGVYDLLLACLAALALAAIATVICAIPVVGWLACIIMALIVAAVVGIGMAVALNDQGNPTDVNANLGNLEQRVDILVVRGTWVFDTAHEGWNELHPIKQAQKIGEFTGNWQDAYNELKPLVHGGTPLNVETYVKFWCEALGKVLEPGVVLEQQKPENHWEIHPLVDGCNPEEEPPPIK
jgi:hypothetical protein